MVKFVPVASMSEGQPLTLQKINEIIAKANEDRVVVRQGWGADASPEGKIYIESKTWVSSANAEGSLRINFEKTFLDMPNVVASWGDNVGAQTILTTRPEYTPDMLSTTGFRVFGAYPNTPFVRVNYIAVGHIA